MNFQELFPVNVVAEILDVQNDVDRTSHGFDKDANHFHFLTNVHPDKVPGWLRIFAHLGWGPDQVGFAMEAYGFDDEDGRSWTVPALVGLYTRGVSHDDPQWKEMHEMSNRMYNEDFVRRSKMPVTPKGVVLIPSKISAKEALCQFIGTDWDSLEGDHRYHAGLTTIPVYSHGQTYVCATANGKKVPKSVSEYISNGEGQFVEATGDTAAYCKARGRTLWVYESC